MIFFIVVFFILAPNVVVGLKRHMCSNHAIIRFHKFALIPQFLNSLADFRDNHLFFVVVEDLMTATVTVTMTMTIII